MEKLPDQLSSIFSDAILIEDSKARSAFVDKACGGDDQLLATVQKFIDAHSQGARAFPRPLANLPEVAALRQSKDEGLKLPRQFGNYHLLEVVGKGGMGIVYKAKQASLDRIVALKMIRHIHFATENDVQRFFGEVKFAASLAHPGIVPVFEAGEIEDIHFFTMPFIEGISLDEAIKQQRLSFDQKLYVLDALIDAVSYAHRKGVIHRDLKPENILLSTNATETTHLKFYEPHISDFGLATSKSYGLELTLTGEILGTPGYMSPEQASAKHGEISETTDIYSIGCLMYFLLSESPPFQSDDLWDTLRKVKEENPKSLRKIVPSIPRPLETLCLKCLRKRPDQRYQSAGELLSDLRNCSNHLPVTSGHSIVSRIRRYLLPALILAGLLCVIPLFTSQQQNIVPNNTPAVNKATETSISTHWSSARQFHLPHRIQLFAATPDNSYFATFTENDLLTIYHTQKSPLLKQTLDAAATAIAFHPSGNYFVACCNDQTIKIWKKNIDQGYFDRAGEITKTSDTPHHLSAVREVGFSIDGSVLATFSTGSQIFLWNFDGRFPSTHPLVHEDKIAQVHFAPRANRIISLTESGHIYSWDARTGKNHFGPVFLMKAVLSTAINPAGNQILSVSANQSMGHVFDISSCNFDTKSLTPISELKLFPEFRKGSFSRQHPQLLCLFNNSTFQQFDLNSNPVDQKTFRLPVRVADFSLSMNEKRLITIHPDGKIVTTWTATITK